MIQHAYVIEFFNTKIPSDRYEFTVYTTTLRKAHEKTIDYAIQELDIPNITILSDQQLKPLYKKAFGEYPTAYKVTEEQIQEAKEELKKRKATELTKPSTIFFVNMGMNFDAKPGYISNHRTRAYFRNKYNHKCFIEV